eukprot:4898397-Amphidinium_carterae.1
MYKVMSKKVDPASRDIIAKILDSLDDETIKKAHSRTNIVPDETSDREVPRSARTWNHCCD